MIAVDHQRCSRVCLKQIFFLDKKQIEGKNQVVKLNFFFLNLNGWSDKRWISPVFQDVFFCVLWWIIIALLQINCIPKLHSVHNEKWYSKIEVHVHRFLLLQRNLIMMLGYVNTAAFSSRDFYRCTLLSFIFWKWQFEKLNGHC